MSELTRQEAEMTEQEVHGRTLLPYDRAGHTQNTEESLTYIVSRTERGLMLDVKGNRTGGFTIDSFMEKSRYKALDALLEQKLQSQIDIHHEDKGTPHPDLFGGIDHPDVDSLSIAD